MTQDPARAIAIDPSTDAIGGPVAKVARRRLSDQVAEALKDRLIAGRLPTGSPLPTEMELAREYGVSRTVVREAGRILVEWGLVDIRPGRGMVVADFDGSTLARQYEFMVSLTGGGFAQLMELRLVLETGIARLAALRRSDADVRRIRTSVAAFADRTIDPAAQLEADLEFHVAVAAATKNPFFAPAVQPINTFLRRTYASSGGYGGTTGRTLEEHAAIADAIAAGRPDHAARAMEAHLLRVRDDSPALADGGPDEPTGAPRAR